MKEYISSLEKEFSLVEHGFKEEEKRVRCAASLQVYLISND